MVSKSEIRMVLPAATDPIRIVPLYQVDEIAAPAHEAPAASPAKLVFRGGPLLTAVEVFTIFWGADWQQNQSDLAQKLNQFFDFVLTSELIDQLSEFSVPGQTIGHGKHIGTITITTSPPSSTIPDKLLRS